TTLRASSSLAAIGDRPLQEPVVDRQVGPAGPAAASRDTPRQNVDRGVVGDAAALDDPERRLACRVSVNLFFTSFAKQARRLRKGGFTGCANVFSPIPVTA
ncbi:hypothetical protein, partial [Collinsella sp. LCP21S3_C7]|uniref:hypothetical protein n=1 Tax=Collinsella sp. LCP21S3_C7 TaxID=3438772 RepID=UPI003F90348A